MSSVVVTNVALVQFANKCVSQELEIYTNSFQIYNNNSIPLCQF